MLPKVIELDFTQDNDEGAFFPPELPEPILNEVRNSTSNIIEFPDGSRIQKCPSFKWTGTVGGDHPPYLDYCHPCVPFRRAEYDPATGKLTGTSHATLG